MAQDRQSKSPPSFNASLIVIAAITMLLVLSADWLRPQAPGPSEEANHGLPAMPDFSSFDTTAAKKKAFFRWLTPYIEQENARIEGTRQRILTLQHAGTLSAADRQWLDDTAAYYDVVPVKPESPDFWETLLRRVDVVPVSLALAQAANESGWGTSRFAVLANNLFGEWCFRKGCGIVPANRPAGQYHEVRRFPDIADSVRSYLHNLNTHNAFSALRHKREKLRQAGRKLAGSLLVQGLLRYSARGEDYIHEILVMIRHNRLERFDKPSYM
jgi:Bax protein